MQTSACLVHEHQSQHRDILEDWPWTKWEHRRTRLVHNSSLAHQTLTCPSARLYLTSSDAIEVLFLQAISLLWAPFLLFFWCGKIPAEVGSLRASSYVHFWAASSPCAFWFIQGNNPLPSKDNSNSPTVYNTVISDRTTVYHH